MDKVYSNKEEAQQAMKELEEKLNQVLGDSWIEADDTCCSLYLCCLYKNEQGRTMTYSHYYG
jgi:hypothetical protein